VHCHLRGCKQVQQRLHRRDAKRSENGGIFFSETDEAYFIKKEGLRFVVQTILALTDIGNKFIDFSFWFSLFLKARGLSNTGLRICGRLGMGISLSSWKRKTIELQTELKSKIRY
jgi:hypothetical protein